MNKYKELKDRQQAEVNAFPLGFAFSKEQFNKMMEKWGLNPETDIDKITALPYGGGFLRKLDVAAFREMCDRHRTELDDAIAGDVKGEGFIKDMFAYELANHEFGYTYELDETLDALGYTLEEVKKNKSLRKGLNAAMEKYYDYRHVI